MGCLSRIRKRADSNFQKIISCVPDTYGFVCLAITLSAFYVDCYDHLPEHIDGMRMHYFPGPGYVAYFVCWLATGVRVTMHWLVPVPGGGSGCCAFTPPKGGVAARLRAIARVDAKANVKALGDQTVAAAAGGAGRGPVGVRRRHRRRGPRAGRGPVRVRCRHRGCHEPVRG